MLECTLSCHTQNPSAVSGSIKLTEYPFYEVNNVEKKSELRE